MTEHALRKLELKACPSAGACGGNLQQTLWLVCQKQSD